MIKLDKLPGPRNRGGYSGHPESPLRSYNWTPAQGPWYRSTSSKDYKLHRSLVVDETHTAPLVAKPIRPPRPTHFFNPRDPHATPTRPPRDPHATHATGSSGVSTCCHRAGRRRAGAALPRSAEVREHLSTTSVLLCLAILLHTLIFEKHTFCNK